MVILLTSVNRSGNTIVQSRTQECKSPSFSQGFRFLKSYDLYLSKGFNKIIFLLFREEDRIILCTCQLKGSSNDVFEEVAKKIGDKTSDEVK